MALNLQLESTQKELEDNKKDSDVMEDAALLATGAGVGALAAGKRRRSSASSHHSSKSNKSDKSGSSDGKGGGFIAGAIAGAAGAVIADQILDDESHKS